MATPLTDPSAARLLAIEIGQCSDHLASIARNCPPPWELHEGNLDATRKRVEDAQRVLDELIESLAELADFDDTGLDALDLCEAAPALVDAYERMIRTTRSALDRLQTEAA